MPRALSKLSRRVAPGLVLKPQRDSPNLQAYACVRGKVYRRSTGTSDVKIAQQRALKWFSELQSNPAVTLFKTSKPIGTICIVWRAQCSPCRAHHSNLIKECLVWWSAVGQPVVMMGDEVAACQNAVVTT